jgi:acyl-coenzyme A synthetase/AMP-(fatty) acid ligase
LRLCVSAGEALPARLGERWREVVGVDILDGLGSTEMLHHLCPGVNRTESHNWLI